uniref:Serpin domain-containing protein n=1 Tax=Amphiprion ocellaris TaxID=80972 RepID=A0AAQ5XD65_AMPOC
SDTLANTTISLALFKKLSDDNQTTNIFFSTFSISSAMAMVMLGARGNTAIQMSETPGASIALNAANRVWREVLHI